MPDIDGSWNIQIATPMGTQKMNLQLHTDGDQLSGVANGDGGELQLRDGKVDGDSIEFAVDMTFPFPMALHFTLAIDGDTLAGTSKAGSFPPSSVTGARAGTTD